MSSQGELFQALKARHSKAQGKGRNAAAALGLNEREQSPERAKQTAVPPFQGLFGTPFLTQGFGCSAAFTLGCAASRFQRPGQGLFKCKDSLT